MEQQYKDRKGEWHVSEWEQGKRQVTKEDGHTYTEFDDGAVGHIDCTFNGEAPAPQKTELTQSQIKSICLEDIKCWSRAEAITTNQ